MGLETSIPSQVKRASNGELEQAGLLEKLGLLEQLADVLGDPARFQMNQAGVRSHGTHDRQNSLGTGRVDEQDAVIAADTHFRQACRWPCFR